LLVGLWWFLLPNHSVADQRTLSFSSVGAVSEPALVGATE